VTLRVVHVRPIQTGDFVLGAQFDRRLNPDEVQLFVAPPSQAAVAPADPSRGLPQTR